MKSNATLQPARPCRWSYLGISAAFTTSLLSATAIGARAEEINLGIPDLSVRFDNTIKYGDILRLESPSPSLLSDANQDDGDRNFGAGKLASNRFDLLSELDISYAENYGVRFSTAAYYDTVYNQSNANDSPLTANQYTTANSNFTQATRNIAGRNLQLLDAFVYTTGSLETV